MADKSWKNTVRALELRERKIVCISQDTQQFYITARDELLAKGTLSAAEEARLVIIEKRISEFAPLKTG